MQLILKLRKFRMKKSFWHFLCIIIIEVINRTQEDNGIFQYKTFKIDVFLQLVQGLMFQNNYYKY